MHFDTADVNECGENKGGCDHTCLNEEGGHICECLQGYQLMSDGVSCQGKYSISHLVYNRYI